MSEKTSQDGAAPLTRAGLVCTLIAACARVVTTHDPLPGWGLDPVTTVAPFDGIGPAGEILLAALALAGLALVLFGAARARERIPVGLLALGALGLIPIAYHGWLGPAASVENARTGLVWAGSIGGALAALIACRHPAERALALAACAALVGPLVFRAAIQVYSEHPVMVEDFRSRREEILASHGWSPDSAMARAYERRLAQPDASAWFAMSNVYASVLAGCAPVFLGACIAAIRGRLWTTGSRNDLYRLVGVAAGLLLSIAGLLLALPAGGAPSKGAVGAMLLGFALVALALLHHRFPARPRRWLRPEAVGIGVVALALVAVLLRGLIGERLGELSLLFRWFYLQAATRIFADHPLWGVAPDGFQAAYLLAKNQLSPEEVSSPHSVLFEYVSMLGVLGLGWCLLLLALAMQAGRTLLRPPDPADQERAARAPHPLWLLAVLAPCAAISLACEGLPLARSVPGSFSLLVLDALVKVIAWSLLWLGLAASLLTFANSRPARAGLAACALALLAHAQIELTATDIGSAGWMLLLAGAAAAPQGAPAARRVRAPQGAGLLAGALAAGALLAYVPIRSWQASLRDASGAVGESTALSDRLAALVAGGEGEEPLNLIADLERALGSPVEPTAAGVGAAMRDLRLGRISRAAQTLATLARSDRAPARAVARAAVRLYGAHSALLGQLGGDPTAPLGPAADLAAWATRRWPGDSRAWRDLAQVQRARAAGGLEGPDSDIAPLLRAAELDPHSPDLAAELAFRLAELGRPAEARTWAARALESHRRMRLDPLAGLSDSQVSSLSELLGNP